MTNVIAFLHTTAAYQAAALRLMIAEANFVAEHLGIPERLPSQTNQLHIAEAGLPVRGVNGSVGTTNYVFSFDRGYLRSVKKLDWLKRTGITNLDELAVFPSRIDTNGAYRLATQWLDRIAVDVSELNKQYGMHVTQVVAHRRPHAEPIGARAVPERAVKVPVPMFLVTWGGRPPPYDFGNPVRVRLLGSTPELLQLDIQDRIFSRRARLSVINATELLAPMPTPVDFVKGFFGGREGYEIMTKPESVQLLVLNSRHREDGATLPEVRAGPTRLNRRQQERLTKIPTLRRIDGA